MKKFFLIFIIPFINSCTVVTIDSGMAEKNKVYSIDCSGGLNTIQSCYDKAKEICPLGYEKLSERKPEPEIFFLTNPGVFHQTQTSPTIQRKLTLKCTT